MKSPLLALACCFALGIALARPKQPPTFDIVTSIAVFLVSSSACLLVGLIILGDHPRPAGAGKDHPYGPSARRRAASWALALAGFVLAGAAAAQLFEFRFPPNHISHLATWRVDSVNLIRLEGTLVSTPQRTPYGLQFDVNVRRLESRGQVHAATGKVRLRLQPADDPEIIDPLHLQYGDSISGLVRLRRPRTYRNPGGFDFRRWMESIEDLYWDGTIRSGASVEKLPAVPPRRAGAERGSRLDAALTGTRNYLLQVIDRLYPPWSVEGRDGAVLKAVLLGERSSLDSDTIESFRRTGLYHLLVIAGLHVGLLAMLAEGFLRLLGLRESWRSGLVLLFLLGYASLVEQRAPTLRATLMITAYLLARFLYREHVALNAIGLAALLLLFNRPPWLLESGFQLSFSAALLIAGLAAPVLQRTTEPYRSALYQLQAVDRDPSLAPRLAQFRLDLRSLIATLEARFAFLERHPAVAAAAVTGPARVALWTVNIVLFSAILQLGLLLPMAKTFHRVTLAGIGLNALAIPVMTALLACAVPTVILGATVPALAVWPAKAVGAILTGLFTLTALPDLPHWPSWLSYRVPDPPLWIAWGFALSIVAAACVLGRSRRGFGALLIAFAILATLVCLHPFTPRLSKGVLEVTALDCGGGDALFLVLPDRTTLLVGAGGRGRGRANPEGASGGRRWDPGENIVSPYLWSRGFKRIDIVVLTETHGDHLGGLTSVVGNFRVGEFWHGSNSLAPAYATLLEQVDRSGISVRQVAAGDAIRRGTTTIQILWPPAAQLASRVAAGDDSVVMRISDGDRTALLTGDISSKVEHTLLASGVSLESHVLKIAHQGAKSSSSPEFLARVLPRAAIVNAESGNSMNLPNPETLDRLRALGTHILRTDLDGAVTVEMNGSSMTSQVGRQKAER